MKDWKVFTVLQVADDEFYLSDGEKPDFEYREFKVIEIAALEVKDAEIAELSEYITACRNKRYEMAREIEKLKEILAKSQEALEFYANENSWYLHKDPVTKSEIRRSIVHEDTESFGYQKDPFSDNILQVFAGKTAREALAEIKEKLELNEKE